MYDVDLSVLDKILTVSKEKIESKATKSVPKKRHKHQAILNS